MNITNDSCWTSDYGKIFEHVNESKSSYALLHNGIKRKREENPKICLCFFPFATPLALEMWRARGRDTSG